MATLPKAPTTDFLAPALAASISSSAISFDIDDASKIQTPTYAVIDRVDANGTKTPDKREVIYIGGKSTNTLTSVTRGANNSTARAHSAGAKLEPVLSVGQWADLYSWGITEHNTDGTHGAITSTGATLTTPKVVTSINDTNNNEIIKITATGSAVNEVTVVNASTTFWPEIKSTGDDTNIDIGIRGKGSGTVKIGTAGLQFPNADGTAGYVLKTDGSGVLSWVAQSTTSTRTRSIWMPANIFQSAEGSPTLSAGSNADTPSCWLLDDTAVVESVAGQVIIPKDYSTGNITLKIYFAMVSATSGNVQVDTRLLSISSNADALANGTSSSDTISVPGTAGLLKIATRGSTFATAGADDMFRVSVRRLGSNGSDTATGDMRFFGCSLEYTAVL